MRRNIILIILTFIALPALAFTLSWDPSITYTDGSSISQTDRAEIMYWPRYGNTPSGPWTDAPYTDLCTAQLPDPHKGKTMWYTVAAELYGQFSVYPPPVSKSAKGKK
jgi:hypothetical protein